MNTANNKRRKETLETIKKTFVELIQDQELDQISISQLWPATMDYMISQIQYARILRTIWWKCTGMRSRTGKAGMII